VTFALIGIGPRPRSSAYGRVPHDRPRRRGPLVPPAARAGRRRGRAAVRGVFAVRLSIGGAQDAITLLYVLPVALLAMAFGLRAGIAASVGAVALIVAWVAIRGPRARCPAI
jgi:hypothetical protein